MNQLLKITLIKSAKFEYSEVDVRGNSLLIGANGAGKTTLLRAILYFYTANAKTLGINTIKKTSFSDYYFEYENSYIAYIYKKDNKYILVVVYKISSVMIKMAMFNDMPNLKDLFIKDNRVLLPQELWLKLKDKAVISNALKPSEYLKILYATKGYKEFSLFNLKDYNGFIKTLSNIFINSKVDSNTIKKVLTNSIDEDIIIDLDRIKRQLSSFERVFNDIKLYEANIQTIKKISNKLFDINKIKNELSLNFAVIEYSKQNHKKQILNIKDNLLDKENELLEKKEKFLKRKNQIEQKLNKLTEEIGFKKRKIKELEEKKAFYEKENIEFKIKEFKKLPILEQNLQDLKDKKEFLTKKQINLQKANENEINRLKNSFENQKNTLENNKISSIQEIQNKINKLKEKRFNELNNINEIFMKNKEQKQNILNEYYLKLNNIQNQISQIKSQKFLYEKENILNKLYLEKQNLQNKKELLIKEIQNYSNKINSLEEKVFLEEKNIKDSFDKKIKEIETKIKNQKTLISPNENSLLRKIYDNNLNPNKYLYFLKNEILKDEFEFNFINNSNAIFEVNFNSVDYEVNLNNILNSLINELNQVKQNFNQSLNELKEDFLKNEKKLTLKKRKINEELKDIKISLISIDTKINNLEIEKDELRISFEENKTKNLNTLNKEINHLDEDIKNLNQEINNLEKEKNSKISSIKIFYTKEENSLKEKIKNIENEFRQNLEKLKLELDKKLNEQNQNYLKLLKKENIDIEKLNKIENNIKSLIDEIKLIKSYERVIIRYEEDEKEFEKIKLFKKELKDIETNKKDLIKTLKDEESIFEKESLFLNEKISEFKNNLKNLEKELDEFLEFENSNIFIDTKNLISYEKIDEAYQLLYIKNQIINLEYNYKNIKDEITKLINKISFIFDNSLNIKKEVDILKTALSLQEFFEEDKITQFKEMLNNKINAIVKVLNEEYEKLSTGVNKIKRFISKINLLFKEIKIDVIDEVELRYSKTNNKALNLLEDIKLLNDESFGFGISLFSDGNETAQMIGLLKKLVDTINDIGVDSISLEDSFVLEFRVIENGNDSGYQISLDNIGSNGTDVLVKSMIYIAMVYINKKDSNVISHVILDEIGILSQKYLKALIDFANRYKILFINGAPDEKLIGTYKKVYLIKRHQNYSHAVEIVGME